MTFSQMLKLKVISVRIPMIPAACSNLIPAIIPI